MENLTIETNIKNTLIQQCNYWFSQFKNLDTIKNKNNNNLKIEALGCAKGNLCILKELDKKNSSKYETFIDEINNVLEYMYNNKKNSVSYSNYSILHNLNNNDLLN